MKNSEQTKVLSPVEKNSTKNHNELLSLIEILIGKTDLKCIFFEMFKTQIHSLFLAFQNIIAYAGLSLMNPSSRQLFNNFLLDKIQCWTSSCA